MPDDARMLSVPPHSLEAEQSTLGSMILDKEQIAIVAEMLRREHFYREAHGVIFETILELYEKGEPIDLVTLIENLEGKGTLEKVGGAAYLTLLIESVPAPSNARTYARIVEEKSILRDLIKAGSDITGWGYQGDGDVEELVAQAEKAVYDISRKRTFSAIIPIKEAVKQSFAVLDKRYRDRGIVSGLPTGFIDLDALTAGFQPSDLIILAARPSMGKTSLALNIAENVALKEEKGVGIFSLEMSAEQLVTRMLCSVARVDASAMRKGFLMEKDWEKIYKAMGDLSKAPILIVDTPGITTLELRAKARRMQKEHNVELVIVDYMQLMSTRRRFENRVQEISEISREMKLLSRELGIPLLVISQLSRAVEHREEKRPRLSDLRESGAIEQDADVVMFIYREDYYRQLIEGKPETVAELQSAEAEEAELSIAKQRNGPTGRISLTFIKKYARFENFERQREAYE
ncbi:MAG: replicative DNA helicase [bacterium]